MFARFHAFSNHAQFQMAGHVDDGGGNGVIIAIGDDAIDETAVDFQLVQRETFEMGQ